LTKFYGIGPVIAERLIARLQIHKHTIVSDLTEAQINALSAYLSSPSTNPRPSPTPLALPEPPSGSQILKIPETVSLPGRRARDDPLDALKIETDLRRKILADIQHERIVGSYKGKR
jgi:small subunit ribosomal protein S13